MTVAAPDDQRHRPLPPLTRLPAHVWGHLPVAARVALALFALGVVVAAAVMAPRIREASRENAAREKREAAASEARRIRRLRILQRARRARSPSLDPIHARREVRERRRRALLGDVAAAIAADARPRGGSPVLRTDCRGAPGPPPPARDLMRVRVPLACVAVTSDVAPSRSSSGVTLGYPYRAVVDFRTGRLTFCRVAGRPGEGSLTRRRQVAVPRACTG